VKGNFLSPVVCCAPKNVYKLYKYQSKLKDAGVGKEDLQNNILYQKRIQTSHSQQE
jgi:hypothetical protein